MDDFTRDIDTIRRIKAVPTILDVVCKSTGMGFAAVARVTEDRWIACEVLDNIDFGLKPAGELRIETTICNEIRDSREEVVIDNVAEDDVYCGHHTPAFYGFKSYISVPIILADGSFFGTLCAIDPRPAKLKGTEIIGMFRLFAELVAVHVDARSQLIESQGELADERGTAELREQFVAVLGHDLRNPVAAVNGGIRMLMGRTEDERSKVILQMMSASTHRMGVLIDNTMDFARGRLGGGLTLNVESKSLEDMVTSVVDEIRVAHPDRRIETRVDVALPYRGDHARLGQLLSNLLGNAVTHGAAGTPITVEASVGADGLKLSVSNGGEAIPEATRDKLFQPFQRGGAGANKEGLGLGLYIASEIARAHGGTLEVVSNEQETRFTLTAPSLA